MFEREDCKQSIFDPHREPWLKLYKATESRHSFLHIKTTSHSALTLYLHVPVLWISISLSSFLKYIITLSVPGFTGIHFSVLHIPYCYHFFYIHNTEDRIYTFISYEIVLQDY